MAKVQPYLYGNSTPPANTRVFGTPGGSLVSSGFGDDSVNAGTAGEVAVSKVLDAIASATPGFYVFHSVKPKGWQGDIDHVVLYGRRIVVIDAKNWAAGSVYGMNSKGDKATKDGKTFVGSSISVSKYVSALTRMFPHHKVSGALCVSKSGISLQGNPRDFSFVNLDGLDTLMRSVVSREGRCKDIKPSKLVPFTSMVTNPEFGAVVKKVDTTPDVDWEARWDALSDEEKKKITEQNAAVVAEGKAELARNPHRYRLRGTVVTHRDGSTSLDIVTPVLFALSLVYVAAVATNAFALFSTGGWTPFLITVGLGIAGFVVTLRIDRRSDKIWFAGYMACLLCVVATPVLMIVNAFS